MLEAIQAAPRLHRRKEIGGGKRKAIQAECVGSIGLLRGNGSATRPLVTALGTGEGYRTDYAVAIDNRSPHLVVEPTGFGVNCGH